MGERREGEAGGGSAADVCLRNTGVHWVVLDIARGLQRSITRVSSLAGGRGRGEGEWGASERDRTRESHTQLGEESLYEGFPRLPS
tara:strand:- start:111 stop:368 length:258 start_codon:yes stop_codon:yes gene_type:complete